MCKISVLLSTYNRADYLYQALDSLKNQHITKYKNKEIICKYPKYEFLDFARDWEDGEIDWSRDVLGKYDCQGNLSLF